MPRLPSCLLLACLLLAAAPLPAASPLPTSGSAALDFTRQPRPGLYSAGQPSAVQLAQARAAGVVTVIDLRAADEDRGFDEPARAAALGLRYLALPVAGTDGVSVDAARQLHALLAASDGPVLLHCASGNRAGALLALAAAHVEGADNATALELGRAAGLGSLAARVEQLLPAGQAATASSNDEARR